MAITYPIQDTDRFTVFDTETGKPLSDGKGNKMVNKKWGSEDKSQMIQGLANNVKWLIEVKQSQPTFDSKTQKVKRLPVDYDVANQTATVQSFEVVDLTQEEIDAKTPAHFLTSQGIMLNVNLQSQSAFTSMITLVEQAQMPDSQEVKVQDVLGETHTLTVSEFKGEMISYGLYCYELFHTVPEPVDPDFI